MAEATVLTLAELVRRIKEMVRNLPPQPSEEDIEYARIIEEMEEEELLVLPNRVRDPAVPEQLHEAWLKMENAWASRVATERRLRANETISVVELRHKVTNEQQHLNANANAIGAADDGDLPWTPSLLEGSFYVWGIQGRTTINLHNSLPIGMHSLPSSLCEVSLLTELDLSKNNLQALPDSLGQLCFLKKLNVDHNCILFIPHAICHCQMLIELHASHNELREVPEMLGCLSRLEVLSVRHNNITKLAFTAQIMVGLKHLYVSHNKLLYITNEICLAPSLLTMDISFNHQLRALPESIGYIGTLIHLNISHTDIGDLPETFTRLTLLQSFTAYQCRGCTVMLSDKSNS